MRKKILLVAVVTSLLVVGCIPSNSAASSFNSESSSSASIEQPSSTSTSTSTSTSKSSSSSSSLSSVSSSSSNRPSSTSWPAGVDHIDKEVKINHKSHMDCSDSTTLRFYRYTPNVPYISVTKYYKEFFKTDLIVNQAGRRTVTYRLPSGSFFAFNCKNGTFSSNDLAAFSGHPDFLSSNTKVYISGKTVVNDVVPDIGTIDLAKYSIVFYDEDDDIYAPLSFLSSFSGSIAVYNIAYNGEEIFVLDWYASMGEQVTPNSYPNYYSNINNTSEERPADLAEYVYNELCMSFDSYRGYTEQMVFGDETFRALGLNTLLRQYYPKIVQYLLSPYKNYYYQGLKALFSGLYDGGHTYLPEGSSVYEMAKAEASRIPEFKTLFNQVNNIQNKKAYTYYSFYYDRPFGSNGYYYHHPEGSDTAYIGFPKFYVDYEGWDDYYKGLGEAPTEGDTFGYVLSSFNKAKQEGVKNIVLDICSNGGGSTLANIGLLGLLNGGVGYDSYIDTFNKYHIVDECIVDINLDGKCDEKDKEAAKAFDFNIGILTSGYSFSCANLFPACAKELGYKIIGQQSGGGSCSICSQTTADGIPFIRSNFVMCTNRAGDNIDGGVPVDYPIEYGDRPTLPFYDIRPFYNIDAIGLYLSNAYKRIK